MRTMKDKERFFIIVKVFLSLYGPATAIEISNYINKCPVRMEKEFSPVAIGVLLRGHRWVEKHKEKNKGPWIYELKV